MPVTARGIVPGTIRGTAPLGDGADIGVLITITIIMPRLTGIIPTDVLPIRAVIPDQALAADGVRSVQVDGAVSVEDVLPLVRRHARCLQVRPEAEALQPLL